MFAIPTLKDLLTKARLSFRANLKGSDANLWPNNVYVSAKVMGGLVFELFGFADYIQRQKFAITADGDNLDLHGNEFGIPRKPAYPAQGGVVIATDGAMTVLVGAVFQRLDGFQYRVLNGGSRNSAGNLTVEAIAVADGKAGIAEAGTPLSLVSGFTGSGIAEVGADGIRGGSDVEGDEQYRARILFRKRNPPHGGSPADYVIWGTEVSGVTRIFVEPRWNGVGTVRVFVLMDDLYPANGLPQIADIARVKSHIDSLAPATADVHVAAPVAHPIDITISGLTPNNSAVREAVLSELREMFARRSRAAGTAAENPGMPFLAIPASFSRSWIWQAVANASGEDRHVIMSPTADPVIASGEIATLGAVSFA